jgi:hypothetical protein
MTAILQLLVFVACAFAFALYLLWKDRCESPRERQSQDQGSLYFPEHLSADEEQHSHRGAAMSRL